MKRTEPKSLASIIDETLKASNLDKAAYEHRASFVWAEVVGDGINRYTSRRYVDNGNLHVFITSASLKNELSFHKSRIIEAINRAVGTDIIHTLTIH